jgi:hypothetical protein
MSFQDWTGNIHLPNHAATKAGIHRKTLEYWLRRSAAGDAGYDIEWQGIEWRFHEHCTSAIDEADDSLRAVMWHAMGVVSKTDENGNFILEACSQPNMKMARHFLEWQRPEKWGKRRKRHVPHNAGVLVIGGDVTLRSPNMIRRASVKARKWKSFSRKFRGQKPSFLENFRTTLSGPQHLPMPRMRKQNVTIAGPSHKMRPSSPARALRANNAFTPLRSVRSARTTTRRPRALP